MMDHMGAPSSDIATMPRGGFNASCLDRMLQTDRDEYLDRDDVDDDVKRQVIDALDWTGRVFRNHEKFAALALDVVADVPDPKILELGAGHGAVSRLLLENHPTAEVTVTDVDPCRWPGWRPATSVNTPAPRCARWMRRPSTRPTAPTTWRCSRCRSTICRPERRPGFSQRAPGSRTR